LAIRSDSAGTPALVTALRIIVPAVLLGVGSLVLVFLASAGSQSSPYPAGGRGHDISFPQCNRPLPHIEAFAVIGVTGGRPFTSNPCLFNEYAWATLAPTAPSLYMNISGAFGSNADAGNSGPAGNCQPGDTPCIAYNYGFNAAHDAHAHASSAGVASQTWWLDVETANSWWSETAYNQRVIQGAHAFFALSGLTVGVYSTNYQWNLLMGSYSPGLPVWYATAAGYAGAPAYCANFYDFAGGGVLLVQYYGGDFDADYACDGAQPVTPAGTVTPGSSHTPTGTLAPEASETPSPTPSSTSESGPSATASPTLTVTPTKTASATPTYTFTPTLTPTATGTSTPASTPTPPALVGDANCDGVVNSIDVALVLQYEAGLLSSLACQQAADANRDGAVNALDAALILQYVASLIDRL
jgi:cell division septation protein DedD